jgi:beta-phosphoglucomutase family hydrolase
VLGLPDGVGACLFDLDGVLTKTATVHAAAWKEMFDEFLRAWSERTGEPFVPFDAHHDYDRYVDGRPRLDGTRGFLQSRGIDLPEGSPDDTAEDFTVLGLSNRKQELVLQRLAEGKIEVYEGSVRYVRAVRDAGLRTAVVSSSANTQQVLEAAQLTDLFDARIDGLVAEERHLPGKPAPDMFLAGAEAVGVSPQQAAVFEDALAGVEAGHAGGFAVVIGVDRVGQADELRAHGADVVVKDLSELLDSDPPGSDPANSDPPASKPGDSDPAE